MSSRNEHGRTAWRYQVCAFDGEVVSEGVLFAPTAASAAWHLHKFVAESRQICLSESDDRGAAWCAAGFAVGGRRGAHCPLRPATGPSPLIDPEVEPGSAPRGVESALTVVRCKGDTSGVVGA